MVCILQSNDFVSGMRTGAGVKAKTNIWVWAVLALLLVIQAVQIVLVVRQESLTFDEDNHIFAGYMMWKTGDYGLNPEHPPLVKLLATAPILGEQLTIPPLKGRFFKEEAYLSGRDFLAANDGDHHLLLRMRLTAGLLAMAMTLTIFLATLEWFGVPAALVALTVAVFDPNLLAHSALVTTDMALSCFLLLSLWAFYRWTSRPTVLRLVLAGLAAGCAIGSKHSGILLAPMLIALAAIEIFLAERGNRAGTARRMIAGLAAIVLMAVAMLWSLYSFRYAARPAGLSMSVSLADYMTPLSELNRAAISGFARWHLLPESYLMGLVDVKLVSLGSPTFLLGKNYAHGVWWYFPMAILIKTTLGLMLLVLLAGFAAAAGKLKHRREVAYVVVPGAIYLLVAVTSGLNIGARHVLPLYALGAVLAGGGAWALIQSNRRWAHAVGVLVLWHVGSALAVFPAGMAYANEAWGGPKQVHRYLSDANADWAQQLIHVKQWQDRHPNEECWFAYFARPEIDPAMYGVHCHAMPTIDTFWMGGADVIPPVVHGAVLISAGDLSGCEWPSGKLNPYARFQSIGENEQIDHGVMVYYGEFAVPEASAVSLAQASDGARRRGDNSAALEAAKNAVAVMPSGLIALTALGDSEAAIGDKAAAKTAYSKAAEAARQLEPDAQPNYLPDLDGKLGKL
jgi:4-amino-4-deoxy-L-arabinose transferase-like glycosyltransferase